MMSGENKDILVQQAVERLVASSGLWKSNEDRVKITISCRDSGYFPRVRDAGKTRLIEGAEVQVMHNGIYVKKKGYQGDWQAQVIEKLKGTHEPQEEKVFYEVLKRLKGQGTILELGAWWCYYSLWFLKEVDGSQAICCEPDPDNIKMGKLNANLNGMTNRIKFVDAAAGEKDGEVINFQTEAKKNVKTRVRTVDSIIREQNLSKVDIVHMDIQGAELAALRGAVKSIAQHKVHYLFVSTHHYVISGDPLMHQKCIDFIKENGGHIIAKHTVAESCSGDGLIVASFDSEDSDFKVEISLQPTDESLFREPEKDVSILWSGSDYLRQNLLQAFKNEARLRQEIELNTKHAQNLESLINEIIPLRKHLKRQIRVRLVEIDKKITRSLASKKQYVPPEFKADTSNKKKLFDELMQCDSLAYNNYKRIQSPPAPLSAYRLIKRAIKRIVVKT